MACFFCFKRDEERAARSPRELSAWPAEGSTKGVRDCEFGRMSGSFVPADLQSAGINKQPDCKSG